MVKDTKYLTQMKELPPEGVEEPAEKPKNLKKEEPNLTEVAVSPKQKPKSEEFLRDEEEPSSGEDSEKIGIFSTKDIILGIVNLISIGLLVFILFQFPKRAEELKSLRVEQLLNEGSVSFEFGEIEKSMEKADSLQNLFLDESGLVDFVNEVEKIRSEQSAVEKVTFASQQAVKDRTGSFGIPVVIELSGRWEEIDKDLQRIDKLPFIFRAANISIEPSDEDPAVIVFKYGLLLYVDDKLGQNR